MQSPTKLKELKVGFLLDMVPLIILISKGSYCFTRSINFWEGWRRDLFILFFKCQFLGCSYG